MPHLEVGQKAPDFNLPSSSGKNVAFKDFKGNKNIVVYFYPKDDTPGCTVEACGFRDKIKKIEKLNAIVFGVSPDSVISHNQFIEKFNLPFLLLSDEDKSVCKSYGVWVEKSMYGRKYMGVVRSTFVINKEGKIVKIFEKVNPQGHNEDVLEVLRTLRSIER
jgi:peroxiredoxin Q/BCP